jgi:hypothetical protein
MYLLAAGPSDERMMQLLRQLNRLLDKYPESRRRHLNFHTPAIVPVWTQARPTALRLLSASTLLSLRSVESYLTFAQQLVVA